MLRGFRLRTSLVVAFLNYLATRRSVAGPFLVVAPLTTVDFWQSEVQRVTDLYPLTYVGSSEARRVMRDFEFFWPDCHGERDSGVDEEEDEEEESPQ